MKRFFVLILAAILVITLAEFRQRKEPGRESGENTIYSDIHYGKDEKQVMDIVMPHKDRANGGVMLLIHGGAWVEGDKNNGYTEAFINKYSDSGYIIATMNYRLASGDISLKDMLDDIESSLNYIKGAAAQNGISAGRAMLIGWSSGGHLAEMYAYTRAEAADIKVTCVTAYSGIADITDSSLYIDNPLDDILKRPMTGVVSNLCGYGFTAENLSDAKDYLAAASPITYADRAVPTIICHSSIDTYVSYSTAVNLKKALDERGIDNCFIDFPKSGHDLLLDEDSLELSYEKLYEYAKKYLQ